MQGKQTGRMKRENINLLGTSSSATNLLFFPLFILFPTRIYSLLVTNCWAFNILGETGCYVKVLR